MSFLAEATLVVPFPPEVVFDRLADHASWFDWMPESFRPVGKSPGTLRVGAVVMMRISRLPIPAPIKVSLVDRPREIAWGGGNPLLRGNHRFIFEPVEGNQTRIRSAETWQGLLSPLLKPLVKPMAERIGLEQIEALGRSLAGKK